MKLSVPYYSQHLDVKDPEWKGQACTITNLKMVFDFLGIDSKPIDDLVYEAVDIGGFGERGWKHDTIIFLAHNHGVSAYRQEFRSRDAEIADSLEDRGVEKIKKQLKGGMPVIVSTEKDNGSFHTMLLTGYDAGRTAEGEHTAPGFYYHDPDVKEREKGENQHMSYDDFYDKWRRLCIFFE